MIDYFSQLSSMAQQQHDEQQRAAVGGKPLYLALKAWLVLYVFYTALLTIWKIQSEENPVTAGQDPTAKELMNAAIPAKSSSVQGLYLSALQETQDAINNLKKKNEELSQQRKKIQEAQHRIQKMPEVEDMILKVMEKTSRSVSPGGLVELFKEISQQNVSGGSLANALSELSAMIEKKNNVDWAAVQALFVTHRQVFTAVDQIREYEAKLGESCSSSSILSSESSSSSMMDKDNEGYASNKQIQKKLDEVRGLLAKRKMKGNLPISMDLTAEALEQRLLKKVDTILLAVQKEKLAEYAAATGKAAGRTTRNDDDEQCMQTDEVRSWMEAAIDETKRGKLLRKALLRILASDGIDTSTIILDADLSTKQQQETPEHNILPHTANLRRLIDTPALKQIGAWVDQLLDAVGGYNDFLDQALDAMIDNAGNESIGVQMVSRILQVSGHLPIPKILLNSAGRG